MLSILSKFGPIQKTLAAPTRFAIQFTAIALYSKRNFVNRPVSPTKLSESFATGTNAVYMEQMFDSWQKDPRSVHASWDAYFKNISRGLKPGEAFMTPPRSVDSGVNIRSSMDFQVGTDTINRVPSDASESTRLMLLVRAYQVRGHLLANLDPLGLKKQKIPSELRLETYGFSEEHQDKEIYPGEAGLISGFLSGKGPTLKLRELMQRLKETYCGTIGVEYMHIQDREECNWIRERFEKEKPYQFTTDVKRKTLSRLAWAENWEKFLGKKFSTHKRFGVDGAESFIPGLKALIDRAGDLGVDNVVIGMPHRGRLNVLANVLKQPLPEILSEFESHDTHEKKK